MFCCKNCFSCEYIIEYVELYDEIGDCDFCNSKNISICSVESVGIFIRSGVERCYGHLEDLTGAMWDWDEKCYVDRSGKEAGESLIMKKNIDEDFTLFRARKYKLKGDEKLSGLNPYKEVAPAPYKYATNNRMSPAGISYTYLADNEDTCLSEIRVQIDDTILLGSFNTRKDLVILDLSAEPNMSIKKV